jgi:hypothetical protein
VRPAAPVVFPEDFDGGEHVYRVHPINVQLVTYLAIMPAKEEHRCDSGSDSLDKNEQHDTLYCHVERRDLVCAEICHDGRTQLKIVQGTLNAVKYRDDIHDPIALPFLQQRNFDHVFQHGNTRCHDTHWSVKRSPRLRYTR